MYALRERRQHVTQEDFEFAVAKVSLFQWCVCERIKTVIDPTLRYRFSRRTKKEILRSISYSPELFCILYYFPYCNAFIFGSGYFLQVFFDVM